MHTINPVDRIPPIKVKILLPTTVNDYELSETLNS